MARYNEWFNIISTHVIELNEENSIFKNGKSSSYHDIYK